MNHGQARITYLNHSGFSVQTASRFFVFDYCPSMDRPSQIKADILQQNDRIYVFASHSHGDHFDPAIFRWQEANPQITYVLSDDISPSFKPNRLHRMGPYESWQDGEMTVLSFGSTDAGISFLVKVDGLSIFHAGDLNWWRWSGESQAEQDYADQFFLSEMEKLAGQPVDIAFFPVDRRLGENYALGAEYFAAKMKPRLLVPMHFGSDFAATQAFLQQVQNTAIKTVEITRKGQVIKF